MNKCPWCKKEMTNPCVAMADGEVWCYTCGRLRADMRNRTGMYFVEACERLDELEAKDG